MRANLQKLTMHMSIMILLLQAAKPLLQLKQVPRLGTANHRYPTHIAGIQAYMQKCRSQHADCWLAAYKLVLVVAIKNRNLSSLTRRNREYAADIQLVAALPAKRNAHCCNVYNKLYTYVFMRQQSKSEQKRLIGLYVSSVLNLAAQPLCSLLMYNQYY